MKNVFRIIWILSLAAWIYFTVNNKLTEMCIALSFMCIGVLGMFASTKEHQT